MCIRDRKFAILDAYVHHVRVDERSEGPNCTSCQHFYVTWEADRPRGCRAYGFKSANWPSQVVLNESGRPCQLHEVRKPPQGAQDPRRPPQDGTWA